jgi:hypothetical protein
MFLGELTLFFVDGEKRNQIMAEEMVTELM